MIFDPTSVEVICVTLAKYRCVQDPWKYIKVFRYSDHFCKNLNQRSLTPRWPSTPYLLRSHVWLYPRITVSKSHENTSKYVDTVTLFAKPWTKGHWPLDDLWHHICWGHMCDSTQGSLCPSPMGINQCMWIQWSVLQLTTYIHIHTTYYIQNEWSHSLFLNYVHHIVSFWTTFRRDYKIRYQITNLTQIVIFRPPTDPPLSDLLFWAAPTHFLADFEKKGVKMIRRSYCII